jgi:hypothetical protein
VLVNRDLTNNAFIGPDASIFGGNTNSASILDALTGVPFDGTQDVWACTAGPTVQIDYIKNGQQWSPSPALASLQISALGLMKDSTGVAINTTAGGTTTAVSSLPASGLSTDAHLTSVTSPLAHDTTVAATTTAVNGLPTSGLSKDTTVKALASSGNTIANDIQSQGTFALSGTANLLNQSNTVVAAGGSNPQGPYTISTIGYVFYVAVEAAAASGTPFLTVTLTFTDSASTRTMGIIQWDVAAGSASFQQYAGYGPVPGDRLTITFTNQDPTNLMTYVTALTENSRLYARHDLQPMNSQTIPGFTKPASEIGSNVLFAESASISASGSIQRIMPLYCGDIEICIDNQGQANSCSVSINAVSSPVAGIGGSTGAPIYFQTVAAGAALNAMLALPRSQCVVTVFNNGGTGSIAPSVAGVIVESPS